MNSKFNLFVSFTSNNEIPPISDKINQYFIDFVNTHICKEKKIILGGKWSVLLSIFFIQEGKKYTSREIFLARGARTISEENLKLYEIIVPFKLVLESENYLLAAIKLILEAIKIFFTKTYKKITPEYIDILWGQVDLDYLLH